MQLSNLFAEWSWMDFSFSVAPHLVGLSVVTFHLFVQENICNKEKTRLAQHF